MTATPMIPAVGRTVHLYDDNLLINGVERGPYVAIITQTFGNTPDSYANLIVFPPFGEPKHYGSVKQKDQPGYAPQCYWVQPPRVDAF